MAHLSHKEENVSSVFISGQPRVRPSDDAVRELCQGRHDVRVVPGSAEPEPFYDPENGSSRLYVLAIDCPIILMIGAGDVVIDLGGLDYPTWQKIRYEGVFHILLSTRGGRDLNRFFVFFLVGIGSVVRSEDVGHETEESVVADFVLHMISSTRTGSDLK